MKHHQDDILSPLAKTLGDRMIPHLDLTPEEGLDIGRIIARELSDLASSENGNFIFLLLYILFSAACESKEDESRVDKFFSKVFVNIPRLISSNVNLDRPHHLVLLPKMSKKEFEDRAHEVLEIIYRSVVHELDVADRNV